MATTSSSSLAVIELDPTLEGDAALAVADRVAEKLRTIHAPEVLVGGKLLAERTFAEQATEDAVRGESIALVVLAVVLVLFLGGLARRRCSRWPPRWRRSRARCSALNALAGAVAVSEFAVNVVTLLGLGLAVDYSLLVIARFREERAATPDGAGRRAAGADDRRRGPRRARLRPGRRHRARRRCTCSPTRCCRRWRSAACSPSRTATLAGLTLVPALIAVAHRRIPAPGTRTWVWRRAPSVGPGSSRGSPRSRSAVRPRSRSPSRPRCSRSAIPALRARGGQRRRDARSPRDAAGAARAGAARARLQRGRRRADHRALASRADDRPDALTAAHAASCATRRTG